MVQYLPAYIGNVLLLSFPEYKEVFKVNIDRKNRSLARIFKRQALKLEVKYERYQLDSLFDFKRSSEAGLSLHGRFFLSFQLPVTRDVSDVTTWWISL